jgi:hypothetical protein
LLDPGDQVSYGERAAPRVQRGHAPLVENGAPAQLFGLLREWNADRKLWFVDVELDTGAAYWPMLSLAVARWQPRSIAGAELSKVVRCHFVQLAPDRTALVQTAGTRVNVRVTGVTAGNGSTPSSTCSRPASIPPRPTTICGGRRSVGRSS